MSNLVFVSYEDGDPPLSSFIDEKSLLSFVNNLLTHLHYYDWELSILFSRDPFIQNLNKTYRNIDAPTDVLSFEMGECYEDENGNKHYNAGDIVISFDSLKNNVKNFSVSLNEELKRLIIHAILHLSGMDHSTNLQDEPMLLLQEEILEIFCDFKIVF